MACPFQNSVASSRKLSTLVKVEPTVPFNSKLLSSKRLLCQPVWMVSSAIGLNNTSSNAPLTGRVHALDFGLSQAQSAYDPDSVWLDASILL